MVAGKAAPRCAPWTDCRQVNGGSTILPCSIWAFEGVTFFTLADFVKPKPEASHVFFKSYDGYTNNPLDACLDDDMIVAHS